MKCQGLSSLGRSWRTRRESPTNWIPQQRRTSAAARRNSGSSDTIFPGTTYSAGTLSTRPDLPHDTARSSENQNEIRLTTIILLNYGNMPLHPYRSSKNFYNWNATSYNSFLTFLSLSTSDRNLRFRTSPTLRHWQRTIQIHCFYRSSQKQQPPTLSEPTPRAMRSASS